MKKSDSCNFTLIELMIVLTVILLLASITFLAVPIVAKMNGDAKTKATMQMIETVLESYKSNSTLGDYPGSGDDNKYHPFYLDEYRETAVDGVLAPSNNIVGHFKDRTALKAVSKYDGAKRCYYIVDGFTTPFVYRAPGKMKTTYDLVSLGANCLAGKGEVKTAFTLDPKSPRPSFEFETKAEEYLGQGDDIANW